MINTFFVCYISFFNSANEHATMDEMMCSAWNVKVKFEIIVKTVTVCQDEGIYISFSPLFLFSLFFFYDNSAGVSKAVV